MLRVKLGPAIAMLLLSFPTASRAGLVALCEFQPNIDYDCRNCTPTSNELPIAIFSYPNHADVVDVTKMEFSVSMQVGDPANSNLRLAVDGIDTGIQLTGFERDSLVEKTFMMSEGDANWLTPGKEAELLNALKDGELVASIIGATPEDLMIQTYSDTNVQLCITGTTIEPVPEPASLLAWGTAAAIAMLRRRRAV